MDPREEFLRYRRNAPYDSMAAARWEYWSTLGRIGAMRDAGLEWPEIAHLLGLHPETSGLWSLRMRDRRVRVVQALLAER